MGSPAGTRTPANDAHLAQLVRGAVGCDPRTCGLPRTNVSSCGLVVTLHGAVPPGQRGVVEAVAREVEWVVR